MKKPERRWPSAVREGTEGTSPAARLILDFQPPELQINFSCSWQTDGETMKTERDYFLEFQKSLQMVTAAMKLKDTCSLEEKL